MMLTLGTAFANMQSKKQVIKIGNTKSDSDRDGDKNHSLKTAEIAHVFVACRGGKINCPCCPSRTFVAPDK